MPTGRICAVVTEVPTYLMEKYARHIGVPRAEYRGPGTAGRVRAGESREGTHAHFVFQVYISPAPKPSKWRIGPQYEKCIWNLVYIDLTIYQVYIHTHVGLVSAVPGALVTTRPCEDCAYYRRLYVYYKLRSPSKLGGGRSNRFFLYGALFKL